MNTHTFSISDCGPISHAKIRLNGITVLAGENGSGKSTMARWLNATLFVMNRYDQLVEEDGKRMVVDKLRDLARALPFGVDEFEELRNNLDNIRYSRTAINKMHLPELVDFYKSSVQDFCNAMLAKSSASSSDDGFHYDTKRINAFFGLRAKKDEDYSLTVRRLHDKLESDVNKIVAETEKKKRERTSDNFSVYMSRLLSDEEALSRNVEIGFSEDGQDLMLDDFKIPLAISRSIYLDTRKLCDYLKPGFAGQVDSLLRKKRAQAPIPTNVKMLIRWLQLLIGGDVNYKLQTISNAAEVFRYTTPEGLDIPLRNAATGVISFSILLRLLQNGWLDSLTMLIIDEPEGHLHPQWIVEYARLLVRLHKHLGVKVMVSSHNPDMVAAIQSIARREKVLDRTLFYLAKRDEKKGIPTYHAKELGHEVTEIFDSFNIALDRISQFGQEE